MQENYFELIESEFGRLRGKSSFLSPLEWQLVDQWEQSQIPSRLVINAMRQAFKNKQGINSLRYFESIVPAKFNAWKRSNVGSTQKDTSHEQPKPQEQSFKREYLKVLSDLIKLYSQANLPSWTSFVKTALVKIDKRNTLSKIEDQMNILNKRLAKDILKALSKESKLELIAGYSGFQIKKIRYDVDKIKEKMIVFECLRKHNLKAITLYQL